MHSEVCVVLHFIFLPIMLSITCAVVGVALGAWFPIVLLYMCIVSWLCGMCLVVLCVALSYLSVMCCACTVQYCLLHMLIVACAGCIQSLSFVCFTCAELCYTYMCVVSSLYSMHCLH